MLISLTALLHNVAVSFSRFGFVSGEANLIIGTLRPIQDGNATATARKHFMMCACKGHKLFIINRISLTHFKKLRT